MILYLDSSAKNYILEPGREDIMLLMEQAEIVAAHELARVEIPGTFERAHRERRLDAAQLRRVHAQFNEDWSSTLVIVTDAHLLVDAVRLVQPFSLKAYDAVHLAAAHALQRENHPAEIVFASFDGQLNRAARQSGLKVPEALA